MTPSLPSRRDGRDSGATSLWGGFDEAERGDGRGESDLLKFAPPSTFFHQNLRKYFDQAHEARDDELEALRRRKFLEENTDPAKVGDGGEHTPIRSRSNSMMSRQSFQHRSSARSSRSNSTLGDLGGFKAQSQQLERSGIPSVPLQPGDGTAAAASLEFSS